jgi:hypothetical protein
MSRHKRDPCLYGIRMAVLDLYEAPHGNALEILLRFLENEVGARNRPALGYAGERHGALARQAHVVGSAYSEVGVQEEGAYRVGAQLDVADRNAIGGSAAKGAEGDGLHVDGGAQVVECFLGFGVKRGFVGREGDAALSVVVLGLGEFVRVYRETYFASLMGSTPALLYMDSSDKWSGVSCISFHRCCASSRVLGSHSLKRFSTAC